MNDMLDRLLKWSFFTLRRQYINRQWIYIKELAIRNYKFHTVIIFHFVYVNRSGALFSRVDLRNGATTAGSVCLPPSFDPPSSEKNSSFADWFPSLVANELFPSGAMSRWLSFWPAIGDFGGGSTSPVDVSGLSMLNLSIDEKWSLFMIKLGVTVFVAMIWFACLRHSPSAVADCFVLVLRVHTSMTASMAWFGRNVYAFHGQTAVYMEFPV